ncbi:MAG: orotidine-5'-phosphate decarboxylase [Actinomycetota bacterium]|nr:orotidine-5'-phosphate decarboxylase [Actinomycetota bacterium]
MPDAFAARVLAARRARGPLVLGLDPSAALLASWGLADDAAGLEAFVDVALAAAADSVGLIKPQSAFYERHGWRGMQALERLVREARATGLLVILDAKRGDIGTTNAAYAQTYFGEGAPLACDALTLSPYLGLGAMEPFFAAAGAAGGGLFVVVHSSNPEGRALQQAMSATGRSVAASLLEEIGEHNARSAGTLGPIGAVVAAGAPREWDLPAMRGLFLVPGIGAQGATPQDVVSTFSACPGRALPSASRSLLAAGPDPGRISASARELSERFGELLAD